MTFNKETHMDDLTQFLAEHFDHKIVITAMPWGENGMLEKPLITAALHDYLGHIFYSANSKELTIEEALLALSTRIAADHNPIGDRESD